ncbi:unnamed protein product [Ectocarpus sp. CCAP 1310/34]|nr:unnamed protein product [Ectocarpus sp. CCAP 1310/34]
MEGSPPEPQKPLASSPGSMSNLDSFFKRLGQGQSSRLWAGPGRSGAVPGSLRTSRLQPRNNGRDISRPAAAAAAATDEDSHNRGVNGGGASAGAGAGNAENDRGRRNGAAEDLSPFGTRQGWSEVTGSGGGGTGGVNRPSGGGSAGGTPFGSGSGARSSINSSGSPFGSPQALGNDLISAPPSPSPAPPLPPNATTASPQALSAAAVIGARPAATKQQSKPSPPPPSPTPAAAPALATRPSYRDKRFDDVLGEEVVELDELRKLSWNGVPPVHRAAVWQLLVGYMPANRARRGAALERKRREYWEAVPHYFDVPDAARSLQEQNILRQILVDVPRTCPDVPFFHQDKVQRAMERILYIWAIRHPASGYVQGINDLLTPLYVVFLSAHVGPSVESKDVSKVDKALLDEVEADVYWCLTKLLDNIQDHYTAMQPGLQRMVLRLEELVQRIDADLHRHITDEGLMYMQFAFRWMNCLLMRELPQRAVVRAWDTYLSEENGFESFHVYVSAALLCHFSGTLREMDFQTMVMFLQDMPTKEWGEEEVEPLLSQAYILSTLFEGSPNHLGAA